MPPPPAHRRARRACRGNPRLLSPARPPTLAAELTRARVPSLASRRKRAHALPQGPARFGRRRFGQPAGVGALLASEVEAAQATSFSGRPQQSRQGGASPSPGHADGLPALAMEGPSWLAAGRLWPACAGQRGRPAPQGALRGQRRRPAPRRLREPISALRYRCRGSPGRRPRAAAAVPCAWGRAALDPPSSVQARQCSSPAPRLVAVLAPVP